MSESIQLFKEIQEELNKIRASGIKGEELTQVLLYAVLQELEYLNSDDSEDEEESH